MDSYQSQFLFYLLIASTYHQLVLSQLHVFCLYCSTSFFFLLLQNIQKRGLLFHFFICCLAASCVLNHLRVSFAFFELLCWCYIILMRRWLVLIRICLLLAGLHLPSPIVLGWARQLNNNKKKAASSAVAAEESGFPRLFYRNIGSRALFRVECIVVRGVVYFERRAYTWNGIIRHMRGQISKFAAPLRCESHQLVYLYSFHQFRVLRAKIWWLAILDHMIQCKQSGRCKAIIKNMDVREPFEKYHVPNQPLHLPQMVLKNSIVSVLANICFPNFGLVLQGSFAMALSKQTSGSSFSSKKTV